MYTIFLAECKKALDSRKNWFTLILFGMLLFIFVLTNEASFSYARQREIDLMTLTPDRITRRANVRWTATRYNPEWMAWLVNHHIVNETQLQDASNSYYATRRMAVHAQQMVMAMTANDRTAEVYFLNHLFRESYELYMYRFNLWGVAQVPGRGYVSRLGPGIPLDYLARAAFYQANHHFTRHFVNNDILFLYVNEMRGINFAYQAMRQILPLAVLLITVMAVSNVFTSDNTWGGYKILLLHPLSRKKVFFAKMAAACFIAFVMVFGPILLLGLVVGMVNGFGPHNYPILTQTGAFATFMPLANNLAADQVAGNPQWRLLEFTDVFFKSFTYTGFAYIPENPSMGITPFTSHERWDYYMFTPNPALRYTPIVLVMLQALPLYFLLILLAVALISLLSAVFQHSISVLIVGVLVSLGVAFFPAPVSDISVWARLNPFMYTNPINILNGLGSTTALTGVVVLAGWCVVLVVVGLFIFTRRDIKC